MECIVKLSTKAHENSDYGEIYEKVDGLVANVNETGRLVSYAFMQVQ